MLVAAPERWDEACFSVPAVRALLGAGLSTGVVCPARQRPLWETLDGLEVLDFPPKAKPKTLAAELGAWKAALIWEPGIASDSIVRAGIPRRLGPADPRLKRALTDPVAASSKPGPVEHRVRHYLTVVETLGMTTAKPEFFAPASPGLDPEPGAVLLSPDSDFGPSHEWDLERWVALGTTLAEGGSKVTVAGLPKGRELGRELALRLGGETPFFKADPMEKTLPLLAVHPLVVAADGSLPHLAAHFGATCVTLFGPNDPAWKRPLGKRHRVARRDVECSPCFQARCPLDMRCQRELELEKVLMLVRGLGTTGGSGDPRSGSPLP